MTSRRPAREPGPVGLLAAILHEHTDQPEAGCIGHAELFDKAQYPEDANTQDEHIEALHEAFKICFQCPYLDCETRMGKPSVDRSPTPLPLDLKAS